MLITEISDYLSTSNEIQTLMQEVSDFVSVSMHTGEHLLMDEKLSNQAMQTLQLSYTRLCYYLHLTLL